MRPAKLHSAETTQTTGCDFVQMVPEFRDLFEAVASGYGAIGSRFSHESMLINYPFFKILCNRGFHLIVKLLLLHNVRDISNNLKLYRTEILKELGSKNSIRSQRGDWPETVTCRLQHQRGSRFMDQSDCRYGSLVLQNCERCAQLPLRFGSSALAFLPRQSWRCKEGRECATDINDALSFMLGHAY